MALGSENGLSASDVALLSGNNRGGGGAWNGEWLIALIVLFMFPMMFGRNGMWGNGGNDGNGGGGVAPSLLPYAIGANGASTRADLCSELNFNGLDNAVRGIQQGICDSTFALNNSINNVGMQMMNGFHGVDNAICNLGFTTQQGFNATQVAMMQGNNALQAQLADCCCNNRVGQMQIQNQMASDTCAIQNTIQNATRDLAENSNCNARAILDALTAQRIEAKDERIAAQAAQIQALQLSASQAAQNSILMAAMDANKADILRRTGNDCPTPCYVVQPPSPVSFQTNCCGTASYGGNCGGCCA